jgi:hypothetical protein
VRSLIVCALLTAVLTGPAWSQEVFPSRALRQPVAAAVSRPLNEQLLDFAEVAYPALFPGHRTSVIADGFQYRYYPETGIYVGVALNGSGYIEDGVYVLGGKFGSAVTYVGLVTSYISPFACTEPTSDPLQVAPQLCHDLNGDGVIDTMVAISANVLTLSGAVSRQLTLSDFAAGARISSITGIGQYVGGPLSELAVRVDDFTATGNRSVLYIFDSESGAEIARWTQPFRTPTLVWIGYPSTPGKRRIPVVAPGQEQSNVTWNYLCKFAPGTSSAGCGAGFASIDAYPANVASYRRHQGAWLQDTDGDGTEDVNISFYSVTSGHRQDGGVLAVSLVTGVRTWLPLNLSESGRDAEELVGGASQPTYASLATLAQGFDSGRLYGAASAFTSGGRDKTLLIGGQAVGYFPQETTNPDDAWQVMCNVARYVGVIDSPSGNVGARRLEWGWYFGFHQAVFQNSSGNGALLKRAAMAHGCIHRYSDSRVTSTQGTHAVAFSVFRLLSPAPSCEAEQRSYFNSGFADAANQVYLKCIIGTAAQPGRWMLQVLDESNGSGVVALNDAYMWGYTDKLLPGGQTSFVVEPFSQPTPFARPPDSSISMNIYALQSSPSWQLVSVGAFPVGGRPALRYDAYDANPPVSAQNKTGNFWHLRTRPNAFADGLVDIQLQNGQWVGYSPATRAVVAK